MEPRRRHTIDPLSPGSNSLPTIVQRRLHVLAAGAVFLLSTSITSLASDLRPSPVTAPAIFGTDDRRDLVDVSEPGLREAASAVGLLVDNFDLGCGVSSPACDLQLVFNGRFCADEPFATQPTVGGGFCTGFLIAPDLLATAGHCISELGCPFTAFVLDFAISEPDGAANHRSLNTYRCAEIVETVTRYGFEDDGRFQGGADYAVLRLDRPVDDRAPLTLRREPRAAIGDELVVIGHPHALPLKVADGAEVVVVGESRFSANLDGSHGNSGSPVLDAKTLDVVGVLVTGPPDQIFDSLEECERSARYTDADGFILDFVGVTHAALLPAADSCLETGTCPTSVTTATCASRDFLGFLNLHDVQCRECSGERDISNIRQRLRKAFRVAERKGRKARRPRAARKVLRHFERQLERSAAKLEQLSVKGRVSAQCKGALDSVIAEALGLTRLVLSELPP